MKRLTYLRTGVLFTIAAVLSVVASIATAEAEGEGVGETVVVELRIWQNVDDAEDIWLSARPAGGDWDDLGTFPFQFDEDLKDGLLASENSFY